MSESLNTKVRSAAKWSLITEVTAKLIQPFAQLVLARILAPDAFGILAVVIMVVNFAEMFSDAGFQKYLIQHEFEDDDDLDRNANVAFWSSIVTAFVLLGLIALFRNPLAHLVGNPTLGIPLVVTACTLPLTAITSTQQALFRRSFEYKKIMPIRLISAAIPLFVSVPLALAGFGFWSLIIATLGGGLVNAVGLTLVSNWKPRFYYSFELLWKMFSFSSWSLLEAISIWLSAWAGTFIVGNVLTPHEVGLYRQPMTFVNSMFGLITSATTPILFSALSRLQFKMDEFRQFFLRFQFLIGLAVLPIGAIAFFYRDFLTHLLLGGQWHEATMMFGSWSLAMGFTVVFSNYCSEVYRALGLPRISLLSQCLYLAVMIPALYFSAKHSFAALVIVNALVKLVQIIINQILTYTVAGIGFLKVVINLRAPLIGAFITGGVSFLIEPHVTGNAVLALLAIVASALLYIGVSLCFKETRNTARSLLKKRK